MIFNVTGGGGTALNFSVRAYATEDALLEATPPENTIGIITGTPITSWIFSATEPSPAAAGMVWISIGTSSAVEFNALVKNGIQVYPISAMQYVGGAWVDVTAKSYQGGAWVDWFFYVYNPGDDGSVFYVYKPSGSYTGQISTSFVNDGISLKNTNTTGAYGVRIATNNQIDISMYSKLCAKVRFNSVGSGGSTHSYLGVALDRSGLSANYSASAKYSSVLAGEYLYEVDISGIDTPHYIEFFFDIYSSSVDAKIISIWLE